MRPAPLLELPNMTEKDIEVAFVVCRNCGDHVPLPDDSIGPDRTDSFNVVTCLSCSIAFDYEDSDVKFMPKSEWLLRLEKEGGS